MAEQFLTLMADLDEDSQKIMGEWYEHLKENGFIGMQTPGLPYHISLGSFALDREQDVVREMHRLAEKMSSVPVNISHIGIFAGGQVLFCGPDMSSPELLSIQKEIQIETVDQFSWSPHATILLDETETICKALPILLKDFRPFMGKITRLHLCAFWPTREIAAIELKN